MNKTTEDLKLPFKDGFIFARRWGEKEGQLKPIILLHDSLGSVELWRDFPSALAETTKRQVFAYDRLGFGRSSKRKEPPSLNFILEEAELYFPEIIKNLGISSYILFGHSVGGAMAIKIAALYPEQCLALISESAQAFVEPLTLAGIREAEQTFKKAEHFARLSKYHGDKAEWVLKAWTETWLSEDFSSWSLAPYLPQVKCPVLIIHGDRDEYGSKAFPHKIREGVCGSSSLNILNNCGHVPHREKKEDVLELTASFLKETP